MDGIPLTERNGGVDVISIDHSFSQDSLTTSGGGDESGRPRTSRRQILSTRRNSGYVPKYRLSRYKNALKSLMPMRRIQTSAELPIDSIGFLSNVSFFWVRQQLVRKNEIDVLPRPPFADTADVNGKRFLGIFKDEVSTRGHIRGSTFRVAWRFCRTRVLIAAFMHILSILIALLGPAIFLQTILRSIDRELRYIEIKGDSDRAEKTVENDIQEDIYADIPNYQGSSEYWFRAFNVMGFILFFWLTIFLKNIVQWLNLRTAIRLRTAIAAAVFKRAMKSTISNRIAPHQIIALVEEEGEVIMDLVQKGSLVIGTTFGVIATTVTSFFLLGLPGIWQLLAFYPILLVVIVIAKISSNQLSRSFGYSALKLSIVEELCVNFKNIMMLGFDRILQARFSEAVTSQLCFARWSEIISCRFSGNMTSAILLGGLYLNWCDYVIYTGSIEVIILIVIYAHILKTVVLIDYTEAIQSLIQGRDRLEKVKIALSIPQTDPSKSRPRNKLSISMLNAVLYWPPTNPPKSTDAKSFRLKIEEFYTPKGQTIGVTGFSGAGKTSLLYAILGHLKLEFGDMKQKGKIAFFPEEPFIFRGSVKENILMGAELDNQRYLAAISMTRLTDDIFVTDGAEELPIGALDLVPHQIQRIVLARALYVEESHVILMDEPFKDVEKTPDIVHMFKEAMLKLQAAEKTVILVTNCEEFLSICKNIFWLENGEILREGGTHEEFLELMPSYKQMIDIEKNIEMADGYFERLEGSLPDGRHAINPNKIHRPRSNRFSRYTSVLEDEATEKLAPRKARFELFSVVHYLILLPLCILNNFGYYILPFAFIGIVQRKYIEPWLSSTCIGIIVASLLLDVFIKSVTARACELLSHKYQHEMFERLFKTSLSYLQLNPVTDILTMFSGSVFKGATERVAVLNAATAIFFSIILLTWSNYWTSFVSLLSIVGLIGIFIYTKYTVSHVSDIEHESRRDAFLTATNLLSGRAVIQSLEKIPEFLREFYDAIEENSTAIHMRYSVIYFAQFLLSTMLTLAFVINITFFLLLPPSKFSIYRILLGCFAHYSFAYYSNRLLEALYGALLSAKAIARLNTNLPKLQTVREPTIAKRKISIYRGLDINMSNITCHVGTKRLLDFKRFDVNCGDGTVGVVGRNVNLIASLLCKILEPTAGNILLGSQDFFQYPQSRFLFGFVPRDPAVEGATVASLLDPDGHTGPTQLLPALHLVNAWTLVSKLPRSLEEPLENLARSQRQLLCLARCFLRTSTVEKLIIVIECPHPDMRATLDECVQKYFSDNSVIIIGSENVPCVAHLH